MVLKVIDGNRVLYLKSTDRQFQDDLEKIFCGKIKLKLVDEIQELTNLRHELDNANSVIKQQREEIIRCTETTKTFPDNLPR